MTYPPPPAAPGLPPVPPGPVKLRGRTPLRLSIMFFVVAIAAFVVGGVAFNNTESKVDKFQRIPIETTADAANTTPQTISFSKAGGYIAYYEASNVTSSIKKVPEPIVELQGPDGKVLRLETTYGNRADGKIKILTYDHGGHKGVAVYQFHISTPGSYKVLAASNITASGAQMAFGTSIAKGTIGGGAIAAAGFILLVAAIVLLIVGLVKRSRHKKQLAAPAMGYPPPPGAYPPGAYPQQGGYAQQGGYPQQGGVAQNFGAPQGGYAPPGGYQPPPDTGYAPPPPGSYPPPAAPPSTPEG